MRTVMRLNQNTLCLKIAYKTKDKLPEKFCRYSKSKNLKSMSCYFFRLICESARQRKRKQQIKEGIKKVCQNSPEASSVFKKFSRSQLGKPIL